VLRAFVETYTKTKLPWAMTRAVHTFDEFPPMEALKGPMAEFASKSNKPWDPSRLEGA
jgi:hypothetical protein